MHCNGISIVIAVQPLGSSSDSVSITRGPTRTNARERTAATQDRSFESNVIYTAVMVAAVLRRYFTMH